MKLVPFIDADGETLWINPEAVQMVEASLESEHTVITFSYEDSISVAEPLSQVVEKLSDGGTL